MLTRIEIDGFKTFKDFALDVPPFLVVLGQNAAGKSNLFDAIAFLSRLAQGATVMQAVRESRGQLTELLNRDSAGRPVEAIRFTVELVLSEDDTSAERVRYQVDLGVRFEDPLDPQGTQSLVVTNEQVWIARSGPGRPGRSWTDIGYAPIEREDRPNRAQWRLFPSQRALREDELLSPDQDYARRVREELASWRVLAAEPSSLRQPDSYEDDDRLSTSGAHLPNTLARIVRRTRTEDRPLGALNDITNDLATVIPEVIDLRVVDSKELRLRSVAVTDTGEGEFTAQAASDGTLRALALVTALNDPEDVGLFCVEEPENGVFPERLRRLVRLLSGAAARNGRQVIVSTHSPAVLAALPEVVGQPLRPDVAYLAVASRVLEGGAYRRVTVSRPLRGDTSVPLPEDLPGPVMSAGEIDRFLGLRDHG